MDFDWYQAGKITIDAWKPGQFAASLGKEIYMPFEDEKVIRHYLVSLAKDGFLEQSEEMTLIYRL